MIVFNPEIHNRNAGYQLARVWNPVFEFFELFFLFAFFPFRMLYDGRADLHQWKAGQWLAGFVALVFLIVLIGIRAAMDDYWGVLQAFAAVYFGACAIIAFTGLVFCHMSNDQSC